MNETERIVSNVDATMRMEDMPLNEADKDRLRECLTGHRSFQETISELIELRTRKPVTDA